MAHFLIGNGGSYENEIYLNVVPVVKRQICNEGEGDVIVEVWRSIPKEISWRGLHNLSGGLAPVGIEVIAGSCELVYFPYGREVEVMAHAHALIDIKTFADDGRVSSQELYFQDEARLKTMSYSNDEIIINAAIEDDGITYYRDGGRVYAYTVMKKVSVTMEEGDSL